MIEKDIIKKLLETKKFKYDFSSIIELLIKKANIILIDNKFNEYLATIIIWTESYSTLIFNLSDIYEKLYPIYKEKLFDCVKNYNPYSGDEKLNDQEIINKPFYVCLEGMVNLLMEDEKITKSKIEIIRSVLTIGDKIQSALKCYFKLVNKLNILVKISDTLSNEKNSDYDYEEKITKWKNNLKLNNQVQFQNFTKNSNLLMSILLDTFSSLQKDSNNFIDTTNEIINNICQHSELKKNLHQFLKLYFNKMNESEQFLPNENTYYKFVQRSEREILELMCENQVVVEDTILFFFENLFYQNFCQNDKDTEQGITILEGQYFKYLEKSIEELNQPLEHAKNLFKLKAIAYIK